MILKSVLFFFGDGICSAILCRFHHQKKKTNVKAHCIKKMKIFLQQSKSASINSFRNDELPWLILHYIISITTFCRVFRDLLVLINASNVEPLSCASIKLLWWVAQVLIWVCVVWVLLGNTQMDPLEVLLSVHTKFSYSFTV